MKSRTILNVCLKVMGAYYALKALNSLPSTLSQLALMWDVINDPDRGDTFGMMINYKLAFGISLSILILLLALSIAVIYYSEKIADFFITKDNDAGIIDMETEYSFALDISIKIFGLFSIFSSVPYLSKLISKYWIMKDNIRLYDNTGKIELASSGLTAFVYILAGVLLLYYSAPISKKLMIFGKRKTNNI